jgi:hypothetical protein
MRQVAISTMLTNLQHLVGVDSLLTTEQNAAIRSFNRFGRLAWERTRWPDTVRLEQKTPDLQVRNVNVGNGGTSYSSAPTVAFSGGGGSSAAATATIDSDGKVNGVAVTNQGTGYTSAPTVSFSGGGGSGATATATVMNVLEFGNTIGEVLRVTNNDPYDVGFADEVAFRVEFSSTGSSDFGQVTLVDRSSTKPVFVLYRTPFVDYTSSSTDFPYVFSEYAVYGAYGDYLNCDSQSDKAGIAFAQAEALLTVELEKLEVQQGQQNFIQFITYGTTIQTPI